MSEWTLQPVAGPIVVSVIAAALLLLFLIKPGFHSLTSNRRWILSAVRLIATALIIVAMLRPGCMRQVEKQQSAVLLILCDMSRSMQLPHKSESQSRWAALQKTLGDQVDRLRQLNEKNVLIKAVGFDGQVYPLKFQDGKIELTATPEGGTTDIGSSLEASLQSLRSQRLAAVIVLSDGAQNEANPRVELPQAVDELVQLQTPLYVVPFGQEGNAGQFADVAVENMADQFSVFVKNKLNIKATVRVSGFVNQQIPVRLFLEKPNGERPLVHTELIDVTQDGMLIPLNIPFTPEEAGQFKLILQADEQPAELVTRNNQLPAFLTVYEGGLRVLYLYGNLGAEQRYLKASIGASPDIQFDFVSVDPRNRNVWPLSRPEFFDGSKYDVVMMSDVDSTAFFAAGNQEENFAALIKSIDQGKGFMMIGGSHSFGPGQYHSTPLADVLPVEMDTFEKQDYGSPLMKAYHLEGPLIVKPVEEHFLTSFKDDSGRSVWHDLPPLLGANRLKAKPSARVLLESANGDPLMIADSAGGRVLALALDSTWLWFTHDQQDFHRRFWRQVVLWLAGRDGLTDGNVWINLSQRRFLQGTPVTFAVGAKDAAGEPIADAKFELTLTAPGGSPSALLSTQKTGVVNGEIEQKLLAQPGSYLLRVVAKKDANVIGQAAAEFIVFDQDKEKSNPVADPNLLNRIASQTREFGGRSVPPEEFDKLLDEIKQRPLELKIEIPESWKLGDSLPDSLAFCLVIISLLSTEWILRKRWGMV